MSPILTERMLPADGGLDTDSAPDVIAANKAPLLENFLVDRPGKLPIRGPISDSVSIYSGAVADKPVGIWVHGNNLLIGRKANSATAVQDPWTTLYRHTSTAANLSAGLTTLTHINLDTGTVTSFAASSADYVPGPRFTRLDSYVWGFALGNSANSSVNGGLQAHRALLRWDGTAANPAKFDAFGPRGSQDIRAHLSRLFVLGGMKPGTSTWRPNSLFWTDVDGPVTDVIAAWQDDVTGLTNELVIDSDDPNDFGVALAKVGSRLIVFKRHSIHAVTGRTPANFAIQSVSLNVGCVDARSVVEYENGVFFMSDQGFMYYDGAQLVNMTESLRSTALAEALKAVGDTGVDGGFVNAARLTNGYVSLSIGASPATTDPTTVTFCALLHVPRRAWVSLSSDALTSKKPIIIERSLSKTFLVDDQKVVQANKLVAPELELESARGFDSVTPLFTFDASGAGPLFNGIGNALKNQLTLTEAWTTLNYNQIPATWSSRLFRLAQPGTRARLQRLLLDYTFAVDASLDDANAGWYVKLIDGQGNVLMPEVQVPTQGDPSTYVYRRQFAAECFAETNDAQLIVRWSGTNPLALKDAALFNAYVEYQPINRKESG